MRVIKLTHGAGNGEDTACLLTACSMVLGKPEQRDKPDCVCPVIREFAMRTNDTIPEERLGQLYSPLIWELPGTYSTSFTVRRKRVTYLIDWGVRTLAPMVCSEYGLLCDAEMLRALLPIARHDTVNAARSRLLHISHKTNVRQNPQTQDFFQHLVSALFKFVHFEGFAARRLEDPLHADTAYDIAGAAYVGGKLLGEQVWDMCPGVIREMAAIGDKRPVERVMTEEQLQEALQ